LNKEPTVADNNIWYLEHPTFRYVEDAKAIARKAGLLIVDSAVTESRESAALDVPLLTLKDEYQPPKPKVSK
jgi:hypothetical protein